MLMTNFCFNYTNAFSMKRIALWLAWSLLVLGGLMLISCKTPPEPFPLNLTETREVNDSERKAMQQYANSVPSFRVFYVDGSNFCESQKRLSNHHLSLLLKTNNDACIATDLPHYVRTMPQANNFLKDRAYFILQHPRCVCHLEDSFSIVLVGDNSEKDHYALGFSTIHETLQFVDEYFPQHADEVRRLSKEWFCASD